MLFQKMKILEEKKILVVDDEPDILETVIDLFDSSQVVTAGRLGLNPVLMAASNSSGGCMRWPEISDATLDPLMG